SCFVVFSYFFFSSSSDHPYPHSFPTRRSSDLVTDHDRDAAEQTGGAGHTVGSIREQFVAAIEAAFAQVEDIGAGIAVEHVQPHLDRKSTRLNSSHVKISYAVFCLKKKKQLKSF